MRKDKLSNLSMELSVEVLQLTKELRAKHENVISNQIGRSATSICANIAESKYAHGRADFIAKLEISLKETNETSKWLEMLWKSDYIDEQRYKALDPVIKSDEVLVKIEAGEVKPTIYKVLSITEAEAAHGILYRGENVGKVVLTVK